MMAPEPRHPTRTRLTDKMRRTYGALFSPQAGYVMLYCVLILTTVSRWLGNDRPVEPSDIYFAAVLLVWALRRDTKGDE